MEKEPVVLANDGLSDSEALWILCGVRLNWSLTAVCWDLRRCHADGPEAGLVSLPYQVPQGRGTGRQKRKNLSRFAVY